MDHRPVDGNDGRCATFVEVDGEIAGAMGAMTSREHDLTGQHYASAEAGGLAGAFEQHHRMRGQPAAVLRGADEGPAR